MEAAQEGSDDLLITSESDIHLPSEESRDFTLNAGGTTYDYSDNGLSDLELESEAKLDCSFDATKHLLNLDEELETIAREAAFLYPGVDLTLTDACLLLSKFCHHLNLSYGCLDFTIKLIRAFIPYKENKLNFDVSAERLKNALTKENEIVIEYFCRICKKILKGKDENCNSCAKSSTGEFIHMGLENQLKTLLSRNDIRDKILQREINSESSTRNSIKSIRDGKIYKEMGEFLNIPSNISMSYYTDGVSIYNSTKLSVWPIYLHINELPRNIRFLMKNTILLGLWYDKTKPHFNTFLQPCVPFLQSFREHGIEINYVENNKLVSLNMKGALICGFADAPAKAAEMNFLQYNGHFGCNTCTQDPICLNTLGQCEILDTSNNTQSKDQEDSKNKRTRKRKTQKNTENANNISKMSKFSNSTQLVYKYNKDLTLRTTKASKELAHRAELNGFPIMGIKGLSLLYFIVYNVVESMGIDPMHCVFSGVVKKLMELWFDKRHQEHAFNMHKKVKDVDKLLLSIKPPNFLTRRPRAIETHFSFFTTAEFKNFCLYFSIPILKKIEMDKARFHHYTLLVEAIYILHKDEITYDDLIIATTYLDKFVATFEDLYGIQFMSYNVHCLLHLGNYVRNLGPLHESSCFPLEALNGIIKAWVKGSRYAHLKIVQFLSFAQKLPLHIQELPAGSSAREFIQLLEKPDREKSLEKIDQQSCALGRTYFDCHVSQWQNIQSAQRAPDLVALNSLKSKRNVKIFLRLRRNKILYSCIANKATKKTASYCIEYGLNSDIGLIEFFFKVENICECDTKCSCAAKHFALIRQCEQVKVDPSFRETFMVKKLSKLFTYQIINVGEINDIFAYCDLGIDSYFCTKRVNSKETE